MSTINGVNVKIMFGTADVSAFVYSPLPTVQWSDDTGRSTSIQLDASQVSAPDRGSRVTIETDGVLRFGGAVSATQVSAGILTVYAVDGEAQLSSIGVDYVRQEYLSKVQQKTSVYVDSKSPYIFKPSDDGVDDYAFPGKLTDLICFVESPDSHPTLVTITHSFEVKEYMESYTFYMAQSVKRTDAARREIFTNWDITFTYPGGSKNTSVKMSYAGGNNYTSKTPISFDFPNPIIGNIVIECTVTGYNIDRRVDFGTYTCGALADATNRPDDFTQIQLYDIDTGNGTPVFGSAFTSLRKYVHGTGGDLVDGSLYVPCYTSEEEVGMGGGRNDMFSFIVEDLTVPDYISITSSFFLTETLYSFSYTMALYTLAASSYYGSLDWIAEIQVGPSGSEPWVRVDSFKITSENANSTDIRMIRNIAFSEGITGSVRIKLTCSNFFNNWQASLGEFKCGPLIGSGTISNFVTVEPASGGSSSGEQFKSFSGFWKKGAMFAVKDLLEDDNKLRIKALAESGDLTKVIPNSFGKLTIVSGSLPIKTMLANASWFYGLSLTAPANLSNALRFYIFRGKFLKEVFDTLLDIPQENGAWQGSRARIRSSMADHKHLIATRVRDVNESPKYSYSYGDGRVLSSTVVKKVSGLTNRTMLRSSAETGIKGKTRTLLTCVHGPVQPFEISTGRSVSELKTVTALQGSGVGDIKNARLSDISGTLTLDGLVWDIVESDESSEVYGDGAIIQYSDIANGIQAFNAKVLTVAWDLSQCVTNITIGRLNPPEVSKLSGIDMDVQDTGATQDALGRYVGFLSKRWYISDTPVSMRIGTASEWSPYVKILLTDTPYGRIAHGEFPASLFAPEGTHPITRIDLDGRTIDLDSTYYQDLSYDMDMLVVEVWYT